MSEKPTKAQQLLARTRVAHMAATLAAGYLAADKGQHTDKAIAQAREIHKEIFGIDGTEETYQ